MIGVHAPPLLWTSTPVTPSPGGFAYRRRRLSKVDEVFGSVMKRAKLANEQQSADDDAVMDDDLAHFFSYRPDPADNGSPPIFPQIIDPSFVRSPSLTALDAALPEDDSPSQTEPEWASVNTVDPLDNPDLPFLNQEGESDATNHREGSTYVQEDGFSSASEQSAYLDLIQHFGFRIDDGLFDEGSSVTEEGSEGASEIEDGANLTEALSDYLAARNTEEGRVRLLAQAILSTRLTQEDNDKLQHMPGADIPEDTFISEFRIRQELKKQTSFAVKLIDCCSNGCMAFTGQFAEHSSCILCKRARWLPDPSGAKKPHQTFAYFSPTNRLRAMWRNKEASDLLRYRQRRTHDPNMMEDIFDGRHFANLQSSNVTWAGKEVQPPRPYFGDPTEIALGLGTDGIPLFNKSPVDCWPLLLTNYSLPDYMRNRKENMICCGLIPGKKEKRLATADNDQTTFMIDTFLQPLIDDLHTLATDGVPAVRWEGDSLIKFNMKAHVIVVSGDMPAISKLMHFKGINSKTPCRCCTHGATPSKRGTRTTYYHCTAVAEDDAHFDRYYNLPLREDLDTKRTAHWLKTCRNPNLKKQVQQELGINDEALLSVIGSLSFPWSFPIDIMHLLFENIMKHLLSSWAGTFKMGNVTDGDQERLTDPFVIDERSAQWKAMAREIAASNPLVPSSMASRVQDLDSRGWWTAETYSYFLMFLGPIVLKDRLPLEYYRHFLALSEITRTIT